MPTGCGSGDARYHGSPKSERFVRLNGSATRRNEGRYCPAVPAFGDLSILKLGGPMSSSGKQVTNQSNPGPEDPNPDSSTTESGAVSDNFAKQASISPSLVAYFGPSLVSAP